MTRITRAAGYTLTLALLSLAAFTSANAQPAPFNYSFCQGVAGLPPRNFITRAFVLGATSHDFENDFRRDLGQQYGGNVRRDASGCRFFPTASEAEETRRQLLETTRAAKVAPVVEIDWIPNGATALSAPQKAPGPAPAGDAAKPEAPAPVAATAPAADTTVKYDMWGKPVPTTAYWVCDSHFTKDFYVTPPFSAGTDIGTTNAIFDAFLAHLHQQYHEAGTASCNKFATQAEAEQSTAKQAAKAPSTGYQFHKLDWTYAPGAPTAAAATPAANAVVAPKPATPVVAAKPASPEPIKPATAAGKPAVYVICRADWNPDLRRFYNPPVDGRGAGYPEWQESWHQYLVAHYKFKESNFGCTKYPTREEAQAGFEEWVVTARQTPTMNGLPSPVIITNWKY